MSKILKILLTLFILFPFTVAAANSTHCGVILPLSGPMSDIGVTLKNSIVLAQNEINNSDLRFTFEDDQFQPKLSAAAVRKLLEIDKANCIIIFGSSTALAVVDITERAKIPTFAISITSKVSEGREYVTRAFISVENQTRSLRQEILRRGYKSLAIVSTIQDGTLTLREALLPDFKNIISTDEQLLPEEIDFRPVATKIMQQPPQAVFINLLPPQIGVFAKQLRGLGFKGDFFAGPPLANSSELRVSNGALENSWFVSVDTSKAIELYRRYQDRFNEYPRMDIIYGYELVGIIHNSIKEGDLHQALLGKKKLKGLLSEYSYDSHTIDFLTGYWHIKGGNFIYCGDDC